MTNIWWILVTAVFVAEIALRLFGYGKRISYESSLEVLWRPEPHQSALADGTNRRMTTIEHGLRLVPRDAHPAASARTVLCLGDSVTFGYSLSDDEAYPAVLQGALDRIQPGKWNVRNAGTNGYNLALVRQRLSQLARDGVRPDVILLGYCFNERPSWPGDQLDDDQNARIVRRVRLKNTLRRLALYNFFLDTGFGRHVYRLCLKALPKPAHATTKSDEADEAWLEHYARRIEALLADVRQLGATVMVLVWPDRSMAAGPYRPVLTRECSRHGVAWLDLRFVIADEEHVQALYFDPTHPREEAVRRMVEEGIAPFFAEHAASGGATAV